MSRTVLVTALLALAATGPQREGSRPTRSLKEERMIIEHNVTLGEAVVRVEAESEEVLDRIQVERPGGEPLFSLAASAGSAHGLSGFEVELQESTLADVLATYTEGDYAIRARTASGEPAVGSARLSLDLPPAPRIVYPLEGALVQGSSLVVHWLPERGVSGYRVQLEQGETDGIAVQLPPERNSLRIPEGVLAHGTETHLEIAAIAPNGNRTVVEVSFATR